MKKKLALLLAIIVSFSTTAGGISTYAASEAETQISAVQQDSESEQKNEAQENQTADKSDTESSDERIQSDVGDSDTGTSRNTADEVTEIEENAAAKSGISEEEADTAQTDEVPTTGWNKTHTQYVSEDGTLVSGINEIDGKKYVFDSDGNLQKCTLITIGGKIYAADDEGVMLTGWAKIDGSIYYFASDGHADKSWSVYNIHTNTEKWTYNFGSDGKLLTGLQTIDGKTYYFGSEKDTSGQNVKATVISTTTGTVSSTTINTGVGRRYTGWLKLNNDTYFFSTTDGHAFKTWSYNVTGNTDKYAYNFGTDGKLLTGWQTISGKKYYFGVSGDTSGKTAEATVVSSDGTTTKGTVELGVGRMYKGWMKIGGKVYFLSTVDGHMYTSWSYNVTGNTTGYKYNFGSDGIMLTGWQTISGDKYYFGTADNSEAPTAAVTVVNSDGSISVENFNLWNGHAYTGAQKIDGTTYYFTQAGVQTTGFTGWKTSGTKHYYYEGGVMQKSGWKTIDGKKYFFASDGHAYQSWSNISGTRYYFDPSSCYLVTSTSRKIDGYTYTFDANGKVIKTEGPATNVNSYSSPTKYLVVVHKLSHTFEVFKGKKGSWKRCFGPVVCSVGHLNSKGVSCTPSGIGRVVKKQYSMNFKHSTGFYVDWTNRGMGIHTILYYKGAKYPADKWLPSGNQLGLDISMGCVRLSVANAKTVYNMIPVNTNVVLANN